MGTEKLFPEDQALIYLAGDDLMRQMILTLVSWTTSILALTLMLFALREHIYTRIYDINCVGNFT